MMRMLGTIKVLARMGRRGRRPAGLVRGLAGAAAGAEASRRGTVLIIVIGALALISVLTLVYATIGQGDKRSSAGTVRRADAASTANAIADYIARTIADEQFKTIVAGNDAVPGGSNISRVLVRTHVQYPFTDPSYRSILPAGTSPGQRQRKFNPTGSHELVWPTRDDPRVVSTPLLSMSRPVWLGNGPGQANQVEVNRDWLHITNIAPDGRYVNLWNLAPVMNIGGVLQRPSGFDAESAFTPPGASGVLSPLAPSLTPAIVSNRVRSHLSYGLMVFGDNGNPTDSPGWALDVNTPAHWSYRRQHLFRSAIGPVYYAGNAPNPTGFPSNLQVPNANSPGSPWYAPYHFADADGDGMFDAAWCELVDASNPDNPISLLPRDGRFRWFVAARVVDLSALLDVNVATDFRAPAQATGGVAGVTKAGATPADQDLRRILMQEDAIYQYGQTYQLLERPVPQGGPDDYATPLYTPQVMNAAGGMAYEALRLALRPEGEAVLPAGTDLSDPPGGAFGTLTADARALFYNFWGGQPTGGYAGSSIFESSTRYSAADLKELLTFWTVNNPGTTSRLEQTTGGRFDQANGGNATTAGFDPLRSNRGLIAERGGNDNDTDNPSQNPTLGNGQTDPDAYARMLFDVRRLLTTMSGSRPLRSGIVFTPTNPSNALPDTGRLRQGSDAKIDLHDALRRVSVTNIQNRNPDNLFNGYVTALMPYAELPNAWAANSALRTLAFGGNPERALRIAAHMTANLVDSHDEDGVPSALTLLIDESQRGTVAGDQQAFPWWSESGQSGKLDANVGRGGNQQPPRRLAESDPVEAGRGAVNIYGIEVQPFLTQAASLVLYSDAPFSAQGDDDNQGIPPPGPYEEITIDFSGGGPGGGRNADFCGQFIAFQLTNPFDEDIPLTAEETSSRPADTDYSNYYIEYSGVYYKLADFRSGTMEPVVLRAGETRTFVCSSQPLADIEAHWRSLDSNVMVGDVERLVDFQYSCDQSPSVTYTGGEGERVKPIIIRSMNPATGVSNPTVANMFGGGDTKVVRLWRTMRSSVDTAPPNQRFNDLLADRLRDPGTSSLNRGGSVSGIAAEIQGTQAGPEGTTNAEDNTGFSIAFWGSIRRKNGIDSGVGGEPVGGLPPYCLEAKWSVGAAFNAAETDAQTGGSRRLNRGDFTGAANADTTLNGLVTKLSTDSSGQVPPVYTGVQAKQFIRLPKDMTGNTIGTNLDTPAREFSKLIPEVHLNNEEHEAVVGGGSGPRVSTLRLADLLLPLGVGPVHDPAITQTDTENPTAVDAQWMTLSEALALALNYTNPGTSASGWSLYDKIGDRTDGCLDRGNLSLEKSVPFEDVNSNGVFDYGVDTVRYPGIPLALNILDTFTLLSAQYGSLTKATPGLINIATAPAEVLRAVPMFAPTSEGNGAAWQQWVTQSGITSGQTVPIPASPTGTGNDGTDIAATLVAARDKVPMRDRVWEPVSFVDSAGANPFDPLTWSGRLETTGIAGITETPGFFGIGQLMTLIDRTGSNGSPGMARIPTANQIDFLGHDDSRSGSKGMSSTTYKTGAGTGTEQPNGIVDDYSEKLLIAQAAMNSLSVRSDMFAVWFVVHGYQKSDTENLKPTDVLTPTVAKRYLMVLDRSNVLKRGEKPRIIMLTELPM